MRIPSNIPDVIQTYAREKYPCCLIALPLLILHVIRHQSNYTHENTRRDAVGNTRWDLYHQV